MHSQSGDKGLSILSLKISVAAQLRGLQDLKRQHRQRIGRLQMLGKNLPLRLPLPVHHRPARCTGYLKRGSMRSAVTHVQPICCCIGTWTKLVSQ